MPSPFLLTVLLLMGAVIGAVVGLIGYAAIEWIFPLPKQPE